MLVDEMALRVGFLPARFEFGGFFVNAQAGVNLSLSYVRPLSTRSRTLAQTIEDFDADPKVRTSSVDSRSRMEYFPMAGLSGSTGAGYCLHKFCVTGHVGYEHVAHSLGRGHKTELDFGRVGLFGQVGLGLLLAW